MTSVTAPEDEVVADVDEVACELVVLCGVLVVMSLFGLIKL